MTDTIDQLQVGDNVQDVQDGQGAQGAQVADGEVIITMDGQDTNIPMRPLDLTIDSTEAEILRAIRPVMREQRGLDISDDRGELSYTVRKAMNSNKIYIYPKPVAG